MTVLSFVILLVIIVAVLYVFNRVWTPPQPILTIINIVAGLIVFFMVLVLFRLMSLPFSWK